MLTRQNHDGLKDQYISVFVEMRKHDQLIKDLNTTWFLHVFELRFLLNWIDKFVHIKKGLYAGLRYFCVQIPYKQNF